MSAHDTALATERRAIKRWMQAHLEEHRDRQTREVNCTSLTEAWDAAEAGGEATLDPDHPAWEVAFELSEGK